jgi:hypothetical protein
MAVIPGRLQFEWEPLLEASEQESKLEQLHCR